MAVLVAALFGSFSASIAESVEVRMQRLNEGFHRAMEARDWGAAATVLGDMAALDPHHPKVHGAIPLAEARGAPRPFGPTLEDSPGLALQQALRELFARKPDSALDWSTQALEGYRALGHIAGQAASHNVLGLALSRLSRPKDASDEFRSALELLARLGDTHGEADVVSSLGRVEFDLGHVTESLKLQQRALAIREMLGDIAGQAKSWTETGRMLRETDDVEGAVRALKRALELRRQTGDLLAQASTLQQLGSAQADLRLWDESLSALREADGLFRDLGDDRRRASVLLDQGSMLLVSGRSREAVSSLDGAIGLYRQLTDTKGEARALLRRGNARVALGEFGAARSDLDEALRLARGSNDAKLEADVLNDLALMFLSTEELSEAFFHLDRAVEIYRDQGDLTRQTRSLDNLGAIYFRLGDRARSVATFEEALGLAERLGDSRETARILGNLGVVRLDAGEIERSVEVLQEAVILWESVGDPIAVAWSQRNAAEALWVAGRRDEALALLDRALAGFRKGEALEGEADALNFQADLLLQSGNPEGALASSTAAFRLSSAHGIRRQEWTARARKASALKALKRNQEAMAEYSKAIEILESVRARLTSGEFKMRFLASERRVYEQAVELQVLLEARTPDAPLAFALAERARARGLLDLLVETRSALRPNLPAELNRRQQTLLDQASEALARLARSTDHAATKKARRDLAAAEERLTALDVQIRRRTPQSALIAYPEPISARAARAALAPDETLLSYFVDRGQALLWIVDRTGVRFKRLAPPAEIERLVTRFVERAGRAGVSFDRRLPGEEEAEALGKILLPGVLPAGRRLLVVPDGPLHHLPFAALRLGGRALVESHEIVVVPSATVLKLMRERPGRPVADGFLGAGAPAAAATLPPGLETLPYAGEGLNRLATLFPEEGRRTLLTGSNFTRNGLLALPLDGFRHIHLATHGWLDATDPRHFGLALSPATPDGPAAILGLRDVLSMKLNSELVVLSSCRSAQGELVRGEGLVSLTRAFLHAGSRSVLVSLWDLDDRSTADFMEVFYTHIRDGQTPAAALREAQLAFLQSDRLTRRHPYRWAPFILIGDADPAARKIGPANVAHSTP